MRGFPALHLRVTNDQRLLPADIEPQGILAARMEQQRRTGLARPVDGRLAGIGPVSYSHLRAHETVLDLGCRLLLEKKQHTTRPRPSTHDK